jgi:DNA-binding transcriptional LysR family regulator
VTVELRDLRRAIVASQHRSLRQAAETLNIRQSTLSRRLRDLEYQLSTKLFERSNGGTRPTTVGLEFLETARCIIEETDTAVRRLRIRSGGENGRLTIGNSVCRQRLRNELERLRGPSSPTGFLAPGTPDAAGFQDRGFDACRPSRQSKLFNPWHVDCYPRGREATAPAGNEARN